MIAWLLAGILICQTYCEVVAIDERGTATLECEDDSTRYVQAHLDWIARDLSPYPYGGTLVCAEAPVACNMRRTR